MSKPPLGNRANLIGEDSGSRSPVREDSAGSSSTINADQHQVVDRGFDQPHHNQPYHNQLYQNQQHQNQQYHNNLHIQRQDDGSGTGRYSDVDLNMTSTTGRMSDRSRKSSDHGSATRQRVITFHCIRSPASRRREEAAHAIGEVELTDTEAIKLTVEFRSEMEIRKARERLRNKNGGDLQNGKAGEDPSYMFERPVELWTKMQTELKRVYRLREVQHACFTFKVDAADGLHKEGGRRAVIMNKTQFLHILEKAYAAYTRFFVGGQGNNALIFKYDIALSHSVYLPPSFKKSQIEYPTPSAEEVRRFCMQTGGMREGSKVAEGQYAQVAFGKINFDQMGKGQKASKYVKVLDSRRVHRYQQPGTNPHLLRFLLEDVWRLYQPSLVIEVIGSTRALMLDKVQWGQITKDLMESAKSMKGWIVTSGTDVGVSRLIGEARAKFAPEVPLLGIASWSSIHQRDILQYTHERFEQDRGIGAIKYRKAEYNRHSKPAEDETNLNPDHTHFILVDDERGPDEYKFGQETNLRSDLMAVLADYSWRGKHGNGTYIYEELQQKLQDENLMWHGQWTRDRLVEDVPAASHALPTVSVVIRGGTSAGTFRKMSDAVDSGIPIVLVQGSGGAADFMVDLWKQLHGRSEEEIYRKSREKGGPPWAKAKRKVARALVEEYGSIEEAFLALDDDRNGVLDLVMLRKKFEIILGGGEGRGAEMYAVQHPLESQVRSSATYTGTSISTLNRRASELTNTMDSLQRHQHDLARSEQAFLEDRIRRVVESTESIAADRDDEKIMAKMKDLAKVLEDEHGGVSSPTKRALQLQEEAGLANPAYLAWSLTQYIRNSILVSTKELITSDSSMHDAGLQEEGGETGGMNMSEEYKKRYNAAKAGSCKGFGATYTDFVQALNVPDFQEELDNGVSKMAKMQDVWRRHGLSGDKPASAKVDGDFNDERGYIINILQKKGCVNIYDANNRHESLQSCMCRAVANREKHVMSLKEKILMCLNWGMVEEARVILEGQAKVVENQKNDKVDQKWIQTEAINKGLSRALKLNKLEFVKLFLDYGADVEQYNLMREEVKGDEYKDADDVSNVKASKKAGRKMFHSMDKKAKGRFKKLFGLSKPTVQGIPHLWHLISERENQPASGASGDKPGGDDGEGDQDKSKRKLKRIKLEQVDGVIRDLLGRDFKGGIGQFSGPYNDLMVWAVLTARQSLALFFWEKCKHPLKMALTAALLYRRMGMSTAVMGRDDLKDSLESHALEFENLACRLQDAITKTDPIMSLHALERMWTDWVNEEDQCMTCLDIAVMARCQGFMNRKRNFICFRALQERWSGDLRYTGWMGLSPEMWSLLMFPPSLLVIFPLLFSDRFGHSMLEEPPESQFENRRLPAQRRGKISREHPTWSKMVSEATNAKKGRKNILWYRMVRIMERGSLLFSAPCSKFVQNAVIYAGYVFALSYQVLQQPPTTYQFSELQLVVLAWSAAVLLGQLWKGYKISAHDGNVAVGFLSYLMNFWNFTRFLTSALYITSCIVHRFNPRAAWQIQVMAFLFVYVSFLQTFAVSRQVGPLLVMIGKMFKDISSFVIIWAIFLIGFAGAIHLSVMAQVGGAGLVVCTDQLKADGTCTEDADLVAVQLGSTLPQPWIFRAYYQGFGDIELGEQAAAGLYPTILLMIYTMMMNLLLVNLLIATMSTTYSDVRDNSEVEWMLQKYETTREYMQSTSLPAPFLVIMYLFKIMGRIVQSLLRCSWSSYNEAMENIKSEELERLMQADEPLESLVERCRDTMMRVEEIGAQDNEQAVEDGVQFVSDRLLHIETLLSKHGEQVARLMASIHAQEEEKKKTEEDDKANNSPGQSRPGTAQAFTTNANLGNRMGSVS